MVARWLETPTGDAPQCVSSRQLTWLLGSTPAPRKILRPTDADPRADPRLCGRWHCVRAYAHSTISKDNVRAIEAAIDAQGLCQLGRTVGQLAVAACSAPGKTRPFDAGNRHDCAQKYAPAFSFGAAHRVAAPVHPIGEIDVQMPRWAKHGVVAPGQSAKGVCRRIGGAAVRFDFNDAPPHGRRRATGPCSAIRARRSSGRARRSCVATAVMQGSRGWRQRS